MRAVAALYHAYVHKKALVRVLQKPPRAARGSFKAAGPRVGVLMPVVIQDVRHCYSREQLLVQPYHGVGSVWIDAGSAQIVEDWPDDVVDTLDGQE